MISPAGRADNARGKAVGVTRVAISGATGKVGSALRRELMDRDCDVVTWSRPTFDLDDPDTVAHLVTRDRPDTVYHCAAWTDVDGCALQPELALRRNGVATAVLARACASARVAFVYVSTNGVFSGTRGDGLGYSEDDEPDPPNPYGWSKLAGEDGVRAAYADATVPSWIVRTCWVFGPPGNNFPTRIIRAADNLAQDEPLRVVSDEVGQPTSASELAAAMVRLTEIATPGTYHLANDGHVSRLGWARHILARCRPAVPIEEIRLAQRPRPSPPPVWGVLDTRKAESIGVALGPWQDPLADYLEEICPER